MQPSLADQTRRMPKLIESLLGARACHFCLFRTLVQVSIAMTYNVEFVDSEESNTRQMS